MLKRFYEKRNYKNLRSVDIVRIDGDNWRPGMLQRGFLVRWMADAPDGFLMTYQTDFDRKEDAFDFIKNELGTEDFKDNTSVYESRKTRRPLSRKRRNEKKLYPSSKTLIFDVSNSYQSKDETKEDLDNILHDLLPNFEFEETYTIENMKDKYRVTITTENLGFNYDRLEELLNDGEYNWNIIESYFNETKRPLSRKRRKSESKNDNKIEICLQNLGKYNEGDLVFEWVTLPVDDFKPILDRIGINDKYEEWFIVDYNAPFDIGEYDDIYELNEIAKTFEDFGDIEKEVFSALIDKGYDFKKAVEKVEDGDFIFIEGDGSDQDFGYNYVDDFYGGIENVPRDVLEEFFDYDHFGYATIINKGFHGIPSGYVSFI